MAWKFWKSDAEKFEEEMRKAFDDRNKGRIADAVSHFQAAYELAQRSSDQALRERGKVAYAYVLVYRSVWTKKPEDFNSAVSYLNTLPQDLELDLALPRPVRVSELAEDLSLLALYYSAPPVELSEASKVPIEEVEKMENMARSFIARGSRRFILEDLLGIHEPLSVIGLRMLGIARVIRAARLEEEDMSKAVELYAEALAYLQQASDRISKDVRARLEKLGRATKCWLCGRAVQGEDVNFVYLDTVLTNYISSRYGSDAPNMLRGGAVAVCRACYEAIYKLSDKISRHYYEEAIKALRQVEERLTLRIHALEARIASLETRIASLRISVQPRR